MVRRREVKASEKDQLKMMSAVQLMGGVVEHTCRKGERYWRDDEHLRFLVAVRRYGRNWGEITRCVGTRSRQSVYSHAQKFRKRVEREPNLEGADCAFILAGLNFSTENVQTTSRLPRQQESANGRASITIEDINPVQTNQV